MKHAFRFIQRDEDGGLSDSDGEAERALKTQ